MGKTTIEICCGSADDAINAYSMGADRVELNSAMIVGGLTPSIGTLKIARDHCKAPIICMVRPRQGGFCYSDYEFETMLYDAKVFMGAGADGLAFGCLDEDGMIDVRRNEKLAQIAGAGAVFHRAFDAMAEEHDEALDKLISAGVKRILTSAGEKSAEEGISALKHLISLADGRIQILPGGGIREKNVHKIINETGCTQVHLSCHMDSIDPSAGKNPKLRFSPAEMPKEGVVRIIDKNALANFINILKL